MAERFDSIVIGAGHNGLVCAAYLARAGRRVLVLEAAEECGGGAMTRTFAPGFKVSACAHILNMLHPKVAGDLQLDKHGLELAAANLPTVALGAEGQWASIDGDRVSGAVSDTDKTALPALRHRLLRLAAALQPALQTVPPRLGTHDWQDRLSLLKLGWKLRQLGRDDLREFLRIAGMNVADLVEDSLDSDLLRGALALDAVLGTHLGPRSPNSVLTLLYRLTGQAAGQQGALALPRGGMGAVTAALAKSAKAAGAVIRTGAPVARVRITADRADGVVLENGEEISAACVVSGADPKRTFLDLVGPRHLDTAFVRRIANLRMRGNAAKLHLALEGLPAFTGLDAGQLAGRLVIAPGVDYVERAFNHAKYGEYSAAPAFEITLPTLADPALAPAGKHVLSAIVQYAPYSLKEGWDRARDVFLQKTIDCLATYAPDLPGLISAKQLLTPLDLEREHRMTGGHWHHGELAFDQILMMRPVPGAAQYASPLPGLYLCGAGAHPGGGVMGVAGMNAAGQILARARAA